MVPDKFNMVDMEGIDIIESQGVVVPGLYQNLVDSIAQCRYQCLYNWKFDGIIIPPSYVEMEVREDGIWINEGVMVDEENVVHIYSLEPEPPAPIPPVIESLEVTENGIYQVPEGVDGYNPVSVNIPADESMFTRIEPLHHDYVGGYVAGATWYVGDRTARTDIYTIEAGNIYLINLGSVVGNRFRVAVLPTDPAEATGNITGRSLLDSSSPVPYQVVSPFFVASESSFLAIGKTNASVDNIETFVWVYNVN